MLLSVSQILQNLHPSIITRNFETGENDSLPEAVK